MPASPLTPSSSASPRGRRLASRSAARPGCRVGPPSCPRLGQVAEHRVIDRWCCWASTSVGASSAAWPPASTTGEHRAQRDDRLARADLALQQPVHRVRRGPGPRRSAPPTSRWPVGQLERQRASKASSRPPGRGGPRGRRQPRPLGPALGQDSLQHERLVEPQPVPRAPASSGRARPVDPAGRLAEAEQAVPRTQLVGQRVAGGSSGVQHDPDAPSRSSSCSLAVAG